MPSLNVCTVRVFLTRLGTLVSVVQHLEVGDTSRRDRSHGIGVCHAVAVSESIQCRRVVTPARPRYS